MKWMGIAFSDIETFVENEENNAGSGTYIETYNLKKK